MRRTRPYLELKRRRLTVRIVSVTRHDGAQAQAEEKLEEYQKNLEKLVEERTKQLRDSERLAAIGETAGMVGHDIRNPLQAITSDIFLAKNRIGFNPGECREKKHIRKLAADREER